ncbi:MAG TPA: HAD family phosphatase [Flavobacterium sp.]|jgi:putative hydrolase of the HAD superfamily
MINTIIFDFGDVFINLNKEAVSEEFKKLGLHAPTRELEELNFSYEIGKVSESDFLAGFQKYIPNASILDIRKAWNAVIGEFPLYRLEFLQMLSQRYRLFLLTNTDATHIERFEHMVGMTFSRDFYQCFEKVYFSYEMGMRKPDPKIFEYILRKHDLSAKRTLFVDDKKENTDAAEALGIQVWNLNPGKEDVVDLFDLKIIEPYSLGHL